MGIYHVSQKLIPYRFNFFKDGFNMTIQSNYRFSLNKNRILIEDQQLWEDETKPGIRCYGKVIGFFAKFFGIAHNLNAFDKNGNMKIWIINKKSYNQWIEREKNHYKINDNKVLTIDAIIKEVKKSQNNLKPPLNDEEIPNIIENEFNASNLVHPKKNIEHLPNNEKKQPLGLKEHFKEKVLQQESRPVQPKAQKKLDILLTPEQEKDLNEAFEARTNNIQENDKYQIIRTQSTFVIQLKSLPDVVFKYVDNEQLPKEELEKSIKLYDKARQICGENNLTHLHIPSCTFYEIPNTSINFLVQEKMQVNGNYHFQKGLYLYTQEDPDLSPFANTLLKELAIFIAKSGFKDVKFDNIPILKDGSGIALYDLLDPSKLKEFDGFFKGGAEKGHDGILNYAPNLQFLDELYAVIVKAFESNPDKLIRLEARWEKEKKEIQERIQKRIEKRIKIKNHFISRNISSNLEKINEKKVKFSKETIVNLTQHILIEEINKKLISENFDLGLARRIEIDFSKIWWDNEKKNPGKLNTNFINWKDDLKKAVEGLTDQNVFYRFKIGQYYNNLIIQC